MRNSPKTAPAPAQRSPRSDFDVIVAGDFSTDGFVALRAAAETESLVQAGYRVGLLHAPDAETGAIIRPEMQAASRLPGTTILAPHDAPSTALLLLHAGRDPSRLAGAAGKVTAGQTVIVAASSAGPEQLAATRPEPRLMARATPWDKPLEKIKGAKIDKAAWPIVASAPVGGARLRKGQPRRIGVLAGRDIQSTIAAMLRPAPKGDATEFIVLLACSGELPALTPPASCSVMDLRTVSLDWFIGKIDALAVADGDSPALAAVIAAAVAARKPVAAPQDVASCFGKAVIAAAPREAVEKLRDLEANAKAGKALAREMQSAAEKLVSAEALRRRISKLAGAPPRRRKPVATAGVERRLPRVLFMPKGGVGIGHITRALAVARRARGRFEPVFVTLAEQAGLIENFGYRTEYIPSSAYTGVPPADWEPWLNNEVTALIDDYEAAALVFDGSDPSPGMIAAAASRKGCKLAWVRRAMWGEGFDHLLEMSGAFDLIIEPGELAAARDSGATVARRHEAHQVGPVTLLDRHDLLSREKAAAALGLDPRRPAVLLQLGSGENRDVIGILDAAIACLSLHPELQIAVAEWANSAGALNLWKGVTVLKGAPLSLYFNAFDFSIAAAGYNTFHEAINFGLPTIFMPNAAPGMDDQRARAQFAQDSGAAVELADTDLRELPQVVKLMMNADVRAVMRRNCDVLHAANGASEASAMIAALVN
jgi:UDP:flavonoid glycosyltransferase YjiC (YdhE family)